MQAEENIQEEIDAAKVCKRRVDHLKENDVGGAQVGGQVSAAMMSAQWRKKRLDRMLVDHFLRSGYYNTAIKLARHSGIEVWYAGCKPNITTTTITTTTTTTTTVLWLSGLCPGPPG